VLHTPSGSKKSNGISGQKGWRKRQKEVVNSLGMLREEREDKGLKDPLRAGESADQMKAYPRTPSRGKNSARLLGRGATPDNT